MQVKTKERDVCRMLFDIVEKPKDFLMCKSFNVYDNKYRINIYSKRLVEGIEGQYISQSYFASFDESDMSLNILS